MQRSTVAAVLVAGLATAIGNGCRPTATQKIEPIEQGDMARDRRVEAQRFHKRGEFDKAIAVYQEILAQPTDDLRKEAQLRYELAGCLSARAAERESQGAAAEIVAADRDAAAEQLRTAMVRLESGANLAADPLYGVVGRTLGGHYCAAGEFDDGIELYRRVLAAAPDASEGKAMTLRAMGDAAYNQSAAQASAGARERGLAQALEYQTQALEVAGGLSPPEPVLVAGVENWIGLIYQAQSRPGDAADHFSKAADICAETKRTEFLPDILLNLVLALVDAGRLDDVRSRCIELEAMAGAASDAGVLAALGIAYSELGDFGEARSKFDLARLVAARDPATEHDTALAVQLATGSAKCAQALGDFDEAERYLKDGLNQLEAGGVDARTSAVLKANLGRMYLTLERLPEAEEQLNAALAVSQELNGPQHPDTLLLMLDLTSLARTRQHLVEATRRCEEALGGLSIAVGPDHPMTAQARLDLASLYREQGRCNDALREAQQAQAALDKHYGPNHKQSVLACLRTALVAADCRQTESGASAFDAVRQEATRRFQHLASSVGRDNIEVLQMMVYFAEVTSHTPSARKDALERYREAEEGFRKLYGDGVLSLAALRLKQGRLLEAMDQQDQAFQTYDQAIRRLDRRLDQHPIRAELLAAMGDVLNTRGDTERAKGLWQEAYRILGRTYGADHPRVQQFIEQHAEKQ